MNMLEEIKEKIQTGEINEAMAMAISEVMKLEVVTSVSDVNPEVSNPYLRTVIDLFENEINYEISEEFISNSSYQHVKEIHEQQIQQGNEQILKNVESLKKMFSMLNQTLSELPEN